MNIDKYLTEVNHRKTKYDTNFKNVENQIKMS